MTSVTVCISQLLIVHIEWAYTQCHNLEECVQIYYLDHTVKLHACCSPQHVLFDITQNKSHQGVFQAAAKLQI